MPVACRGALLSRVVFAFTLVLCGREQLAAQVNQEAGRGARGGHDRPHLTAEQLRQRDAWFYGIRAFPKDRTEPGVRERALEHVRRMSPAAISEGAASPAWTLIGPEPYQDYLPYSGRANAIAVHPHNNGTVYLGTAAGGVWKSLDNGAHWLPLTDSQPSLATGAIAIDPQNPNTVYVGTGEANQSGDSYHGAGVLKTTDGGATWTSIPGPFTNNGYGNVFGAMAVSPANSQVVLAGHGTGIWRSADGGTTWSNVLPGVTSYAVFFDTAHPTTAYGAIGGIFGDTTNGVYKSTDSGVTWTKMLGSVAHPFPSANLGRINLVNDPNHTSTLYASVSNCCHNFSDAIGVFKSTDGGANWTQLTTPPDCCDWYRNALAASPKDANTIFVGGVDLYRSTDGGATWEDIASQGAGGHADQHGIAFSADGNTMFVADDGGVFSSNSFQAATPTFSDLNATIATVLFYPGFAMDSKGIGHLLAGTQDNGLELYGGQIGWSNANPYYCGDGGQAALDAKSTQYALSTCQGGQYTLTRSSTGGQNGPAWMGAQTGIDLSQPAAWTPPVAFDPENEFAYYGRNHVYQSEDKGATWTQISPQLPVNSGASLAVIAVAPNDSKTVYAGSYDGTIQVTHNATAGTSATWTNISAGLPTRSILSIAVDGQDEKKVWVSLGGSGSGHVFASTDGGTSWTDISGNLPDITTSKVTIDADLLDTLYVATDVGVFATSDGGATWAPFGTGLPKVVVQDVQVYEATRTLVALTHGRSAWTAQLPIVLPSASPTSLSFTAITGTTSAAQTITLTNNAAIALTLGAVKTTTGFNATSQCGATLAPAATCTIAVTFTAGATVGAVTGTLSLPSNSAVLTVALAGNAVATLVTAAPSSLTFAAQPYQTTSAAQTVTLTNGGSTAAAIGAIATSAGFAESNTCGSSVAAGGTCTVSVTFTPATAGVVNGTLTIASGTATITVNLTGTGTSTFSVTAPSSGSVTVTAGQTASYVMTVAGVGGPFTNAVDLACTGLPAKSTCSFTPATVTPGASATSTLSIATTAPTTSALERRALPGSRGGGALTLAVLFPGIGLLGWGLHGRSRRWRALAVVLLMVGACMLPGCNSSSTTKMTTPGTPAGSYTVTVTGTSGTISQSGTVTLVVQ